MRCMTLTKTALTLAACIGMTACGAIPKKTFEFDAIDLEEGKRACLVVVGDSSESWSTAITQKQVMNLGEVGALRVEIPFATNEVVVHLWPLGEDGTVPKSPGDARNMVSDFKRQERRLRLTDPTRQLFILDPK